MNKKLLIIFLLFSGVFQLNAQVYHYITHTPGTQNINGNDVTVSASPTGTYFAPPTATLYCGALYGVATGSMSGPNPGNITFSFSIPVESVQIHLFAMEDGDTVSININGLPYSFTNSNLSPNTGGMAVCTPAPIVANGIYLTAPGVPAGVSGGATVTISGVINSIAIHGSGNMNGASFRIAFRYINAHTNGQTICQGDTLNLFVFADNLAGTTYSWIGPNGFSSNVQNPQIPNADQSHSGTYIVTLSTSEGIFVDSLDVIISPRPITEILYNAPLCTGMTLLLSDTSTLPGISYQWEGPAGFSSQLPNPAIPNIQPHHAGLYKLVTSTNECSYAAEKVISIGQPVPYYLTDVVCANEYYNFNGRMLHTAGTYYDSIPVSGRCDSIVILDLIVLPPPEVHLYSSPELPLCQGDSVLFSVVGSSTGYHRYAWFNNSGPIGYGTQKWVHLPNLANDIFVVATSENNCQDTATSLLMADACCTIFTPNAFSPNNDGLNDFFGCESHANFSKFYMAIFNKWGQKVYESFNRNKKWDGSFNGIPLDVGTYSYFINATCLDGKKLFHKGDLTLLR